MRSQRAVHLHAVDSTFVLMGTAGTIRVCGVDLLRIAIDDFFADGFEDL